MNKICGVQTVAAAPTYATSPSFLLRGKPILFLASALALKKKVLF